MHAMRIWEIQPALLLRIFIENLKLLVQVISIPNSLTGTILGMLNYVINR